MTTHNIEINKLAKDIGIENGILIFRPNGEKVKKQILENLQETSPGDYLELDFTNVKMCDVSFVDETVLEVKSTIVENKYDILFYIININEDIITNLKPAIAFRKNKIQILYNENDEYKIIGDIEQNLVNTFKQVLERKEVTAREIADINNLAINSASNKLKRLYDYRLILREERIDNTGRQHIYYLK